MDRLPAGCLRLVGLFAETARGVAALMSVCRGARQALRADSLWATLYARDWEPESATSELLASLDSWCERYTRRAHAQAQWEGGDASRAKKRLLEVGREVSCYAVGGDYLALGAGSLIELINLHTGEVTDRQVLDVQLRSVWLDVEHGVPVRLAASPASCPCLVWTLRYASSSKRALVFSGQPLRTPPFPSHLNEMDWLTFPTVLHKNPRWFLSDFAGGRIAYLSDEVVVYVPDRAQPGWQVLKHKESVETLVFGPGGRRLFVAVATNDQELILCWDVDTATRIGRVAVDVQHELWQIMLLPQADGVLYWSDGRVHHWRPTDASGEPRCTRAVSRRVRDMLAAQSAQLILVRDCDSGTPRSRLLRLASGRSGEANLPAPVADFDWRSVRFNWRFLVASDIASPTRLVLLDFAQ